MDEGIFCKQTRLGIKPRRNDLEPCLPALYHGSNAASARCSQTAHGTTKLASLSNWRMSSMRLFVQDPMNTCPSRTSGGEHVVLRFGTFWREMSCMLVPGSKPETSSGETVLLDILCKDCQGS